MVTISTHMAEGSFITTELTIGSAKAGSTRGKEENQIWCRLLFIEDLLTWKNEGLALRVISDTSSLLQPGCVIERPKVIFNKKTGKFVMWFHHELKGTGVHGQRSRVLP